MRDFDEDRAKREQTDRRFRLAGRDFRFLPAVRPEDFADYVDFIQDSTRYSEHDAIKLLDRTVVAFLEPEFEQAWREAREEQSANPVTARDIIDLITWMTEVQSARPTEPSSASGTGDETGGTNSTEGTSSPVALVSTG